MEKFTDVIKTIAEKQLIPFVSSLVGAGLVYLFVPSDWWVIGKLQTLTPQGFFWFAAGILFLVINLIIYIATRTRAWKKEQARKLQNMRVIINGSNEAQVVWHMVDQLTDEQLSCVKRLVKRKNRPVKVRKDIESDNWWKYNDVDIIRKKGQDCYGPYTLYSLGELLYKNLSGLYRVNRTITRKGK